MAFDFAFILVVVTAVSGAIWASYALFIAPKRKLALQGTVGSGTLNTAGEPVATEPREPLLVEYARTFFPIFLVVLVVRSFLYEPFRIPSSSMLPTLLVGDFIFVNKFVYGIRLPVINTKIISLGEPERGDVVVFKLPSDPGTNYIKRVVGLPGDRISYRQKRLYINGEAVEFTREGRYTGIGQRGSQLATERLGEVTHELLLMTGRSGREGDFVVPEGHYFLMGDNRDNSKDSRYRGVGPIPEDRLVGKAVRIWMNWDWSNSAPIWSRIGDRIS